MRGRQDLDRVRAAPDRGLTSLEVAAEIGVPVSNVGPWAVGRTVAFDHGARCGHRRRPGWRPPDPPSYAYLLGLYLGDGCVSIMPRTVAFRLSLDRLYPEIIDDAVAATVLTLLPKKVSVRAVKGSRCVTVGSYSQAWLDAFPQHGPGRKHERKIELAYWQQAIVEKHTDWFLRGLIESDGCRTINRFKTKLPSGRVAEYAYPRYFFSNLSPDIRGLFCEACERLDIRWTLSNPRNISISHRKSVAKLDAFVGPKA